MTEFDSIFKKLEERYNVVGVIDLNQCFVGDDREQYTQTGAIEIKKQLSGLHKDAYKDDERIIVRYDRDDKQYLLQAFQSLLNDIDISNFFVIVVSGRKDIDKVVKELVSFDSVPLTIIRTTDDFILMESATELKTVYRYNSSEPQKISISDLTDREKYLLMESKTFCMYPWIHLHAYPTGEAYPCCHSDMHQPVGNCQQQSMKEVWSGDKMKELRDDMLNDRENSMCSRCYEQDDLGFFSGRKSSNKHFGHLIKEGVEIDPPYKQVYWDIRFSNLCNLSCRSCGHIFSSSWFKDQSKLSGENWAKKNKALFWAGRHETDMLEQLMEHIDYVEQIYFAGGEPLMMDEHYIILEELEKRKKFDVRLIYNTNFTKTKLKDRSVFDYWRKFDSVAVGASLDAMGPRAEYIRKGTDWKEVEANRRKMLEICPDVDFYISPTFSIQNALHIPDFHRDWVEKGLLKPQDVNINLLQGPSWLRADIAPEHYKQKIIEKYEKHLDWLRPLDRLNRATVGYESALNFLKTDNTKLLPEFWQRMTSLDELRNEKLLEAIPELNELTK